MEFCSLIIASGSFWIFSKILGDISKSRFAIGVITLVVNLPLVSTRPAANLPSILLVSFILLAKLPLMSTTPTANLPTVSMTPVAICHRNQRHRRKIYLYVDSTTQRCWKTFLIEDFFICTLKGQCHEIFDFWFFSWISFPQAPI